MCQRIPPRDLARLPASVHITRLAARREFAPGTIEKCLSPPGPLARPIGFKKANANHVPNTNPEFTS
jgi:hypothetical protein